MLDREIVQLYWDRSEEAIRQSDMKYGNYCQSIAYRITQNFEDAFECRNDTWLRAWQMMPPARPERLASFLGKITRHLAIDVFRKQSAQKRTPLGDILIELEEVSDGDTVARALDQQLLVESINLFLDALAPDQRRIFVLRYWHAYSVREIAQQLAQTESQVATRLFRLRQLLKQHLRQQEMIE